MPPPAGSPEPEELTDAQQDMLRADLLRIQQELTTLLGALSEAAEVVDLEQPIGRLSRMDAIQQQHMSAANKDATELRLKQIQQALNVMDAGDYGFCRKCDEPVGWRRLKARPEAAFCVRCQTAIER
jgi:DnaK suppressor protein